jgi:predicted RNase H-like nuclease
VSSKGKIVGIDGCRAGWLAISCEQAELDSSWTAEAIRVEVFASMEALWQAHHDASELLIDMPIGLLDDKPRQVEPAARRRLPGRAASVFTVPCRQAVYASSYSKACDINQERLGTRLSIQAWNICSKISQLDRFLHAFPSASESMFESHPELAFAAIQGQPLLHSKKKAAVDSSPILADGR